MVQVISFTFTRVCACVCVRERVMEKERERGPDTRKQIMYIKVDLNAVRLTDPYK